MQIMQTMTEKDSCGSDELTNFTFLADGPDGTYGRSFLNKGLTWVHALHEFVQFLKGMGFYIEDDHVQIKDRLASTEDDPVYNTLHDTVYY